MIPLCFPQEIALGFDDGSAHRFLACDPATQPEGATMDPTRIYLALRETLDSAKHLCQHAGIPLPVVLPDETLKALPRHPLPLTAFLEQAKANPPAKAAICLINGGGGGLGDGIMFAPALDILLRRLRALGVADIQLTLGTLLPGRTASILGSIPGVRVAAMPLSLADFLSHDAYVDFSGMLTDPAFDSTHMTDFALSRLGIDPVTVPAAEKEPFLNIVRPPASPVQAALALAHAEAAGKPLVAVVFVSAYTRTMPETQAAALIRTLAAKYRPALICPDWFDSNAFTQRHGLTAMVSDLSPASTGFGNYFALLAGVDAIVSVDTSAIHVGAALQKPTVAVFNSIRLETRITYSPTVQGIQLRFAGKHCQAPCGLSKARAYAEGQLANGQSFCFQCGYACDEAVDRGEILSEAVAAAQSLPPHRQTAEALETIRQTMADRFHERLAPCWAALDSATVESALTEVIAKCDEEHGRTCPACRSHRLQTRVGRYWGVDRFRCGSCHAIFTPDAALRQDLPHPSASQPFPAMPLVNALLNTAGTVLLATGEKDGWQEEAWAELLTTKVPRGQSRVWWDRRSCQTGGAMLTGPYDAVAALCCLDSEEAPGEFLAHLVSCLRDGGLLLVAARNSQYLGHPVSNPRGVSSGRPQLGWERETLSAVVARHGLETVWLGSTPTAWQDIEAAAGLFPALTIQPPGHEDLSVRVEGRDLTELISTYMAHVLQSIRDHGQYWLCCARKSNQGGTADVGTKQGS